MMGCWMRENASGGLAKGPERRSEMPTSWVTLQGHFLLATGCRRTAAVLWDLKVFLLYGCSCPQSGGSEFQVYFIILLISHKGTSFPGDLLILVQILFNRCILQLFCFFGFPIPCLTFLSFPSSLFFFFFPVCFKCFFSLKSFITSPHSNISFHYQFLSFLSYTFSGTWTAYFSSPFISFNNYHFREMINKQSVLIICN